MEGEPSAADFKHEPLPDSTAYIRLLEIQGVDIDGHLDCLLTAWPVAEAPDYYALSYTWGSPTPIHWISINGLKFPVGENCVYALNQAHSSKASRYFWMDALCIDQSTTREKSHQVGMMGQVYARSKHVLACVGPHTEDSMALFQAIDKNTSLLASIHGLTLDRTVESARHWVVPNPIPRSSWVALRCLFAISPCQRQTLANMFIAFMNRSYFSRVWILQELHMAPAISLCCGIDIRSFDCLLAVSILIDFWINASEYGDSLSKIVSIIASACSPLAWFSRRQTSCSALRESFRSIEPQRGCLTLASGARGRRRLAEVLEAMQNFQCEDVRDRLFAVLALIEWGSAKPVVPDYDKSRYHVAIEVLQLYLIYPESRPVLGMAAGWPRQLRKIFNVKTSSKAMRKAIATRYESNDIPAHITSACRNIGLGPVGVLPRPFGVLKTYFQKPPTRDPNFPGGSRDVWYGVQLRDPVSIGYEDLRSRGRKRDYLCVDQNDPGRSDNGGWPLGRIVDQDGRLFALTPVYTRPNDWLLVSEASVSDTRPAMVVVRQEYHLHRCVYEIVGQVSKSRDYKETIFPFLDWKYFRSHWSAEDLFIFDWMYISRSVSFSTRKTTYEWFQLEICYRQRSSKFFGPPRESTRTGPRDWMIHTRDQLIAPRHQDRSNPVYDLKDLFTHSLLEDTATTYDLKSTSTHSVLGKAATTYNPENPSTYFHLTNPVTGYDLGNASMYSLLEDERRRERLKLNM